MGTTVIKSLQPPLMMCFPGSNWDDREYDGSCFFFSKLTSEARERRVNSNELSAVQAPLRSRFESSAQSGSPHSH